MIEIIESTLRLATPLILASMGGILCERSGIATICLEGALLTGAWVAAVTTYYTGSPWFSLLPCVVAGGAVLGIHALLTIFGRTDAIISGLVVNLGVSGATPLFCKWLFATPTNSPSLPITSRFSSWNLPLLADIPGIGFLFHQMPLTYFAFATAIVIHFMLKSTRWGLRLTAAGEDPMTLLSCGVKPSGVRFPALCLGGALCSLGGAFLSVSHASQFTRDMASGRGYIALAAIIFGNWRPLPTLVACVLFGFADAIQIRLQSTEILPIQFIQALPYLVTLVVLVGFVGKSRPPAAIGK